MSRDGLKKIYLIKSAGYEFSEVDLSDNTLLLGESGVGKTTLMRAVLFFYTMDYSDAALNINPDTKKSFNQWYFREHNSHIVYEYTKDESRFLFIVSRSVKLHYTFVDLTNSSLTIKELFLDGDMPVNLQKLNENIQTSNLPNYDTTKKEKYINAFHTKDSDNKKIKQESSTNFALFESVNSRKEFAKTLSNIFASSKVSSNSLKKSIVSLIDDSNARINLNEIKHNLSGFISEKKEIEKFEGKIPTILKLADTHNAYKENKQEFKVLANELEKLKQDSLILLQENSTALQTIESKKEDLSIKFKVASEISNEKISTKESQISIESSQIEILIKKDEEYKRANIENLFSEHNNELSYKNSLLSAIGRFEALTSGAENIKVKYQKIKEKLHQDSNDSLLSIKIKTQENIEKINLQINDSIQSKEQKIESSTQQYIYEKEELESKLHSSKEEFNTTKIALAKAEHFPFNKQSIDSYESEIKQFEKELFETKHLLNTNSHEIKKVEEDIKKIEIDLKDSTIKLDSEIIKAKDSLFEQKADVEKKLDFESENLYGFLNKNNIKNKEKIVTYLKDEILFSEKKFNVKQVVHDSAIFGLELEFQEEFSNEYKQVKLLEQLHLIKEKIKALNKKAQTNKKNLEESAQQESKEKNRQRAVFYASKDELHEREKSYVKSVELSTENLKDAKESAKKLKNDEIANLNKLYASQEILIKNLQTKLQDITNKINDITNSITKQTNQTVMGFQEQIKESNTTKITEIESIKVKYREESTLIQNELEGALREEGVDDKLLKEISQEKLGLESKLKNIEKNRSFVTVFISEYQEKIKEIHSREVNLKNDKILRDELKNGFKTLKAKYKEENQKLEERKKELDEIKSNIELFLEQYKQKIENQDIEQAIKRSLTLHAENLANTTEIKNVIDIIDSLYKKIKADESIIKGYVLECLQILKYDNIFKIEIERDYIDSHSYLRTAKELITYIQNDKLRVFKEISSDGFKSSFNSIRKELSIFEDAILDVESESMNLRNSVKKAVNSFVVIDDINIRFDKNSNNNILNSLEELSSFYDENNDKFLSGLFSAEDSQTQKIKDEFSSKISDLVELLKTSKEYIELEDGFVLEFKVTEKGNDLKWRQTLNDIGSNGTSTLVKSIINISMLQMVSKNIVKNNQILSHCILDEIGTISTDYFRELKDFVNRSGFVFLNGMPIEDDMLISMYPTIYVGQNQGNYSRMILASKMEI